MNNFIAAYSIYKIFTNPIFWACCGLTFLFGVIGQKLTPPPPKLDSSLCLKGSCPNPKKAISSLTRLIALNPKDSELYVSRGNVYCITKQISQCLSDFDRALQISSNKAETYESVGMGLLGIDSVRSTEAFDQAIKLYNQRGDTISSERVRKDKSIFGL